MAVDILPAADRTHNYEYVCLFLALPLFIQSIYSRANLRTVHIAYAQSESLGGGIRPHSSASHYQFQISDSFDSNSPH